MHDDRYHERQPFRAGVLRAAPSVMTRAERREIMWTRDRLFPHRRITRQVVLCVGSVLYGGMLVLQFGSDSVLLGLLSTAAFITLLIDLNAFSTKEWASRDAMLLHGRCAACGLTLVRSPDPDGCTVCDGCGAAWRLRHAGATGTPGA